MQKYLSLGCDETSIVHKISFTRYLISFQNMIFQAAAHRSSDCVGVGTLSEIHQNIFRVNLEKIEGKTRFTVKKSFSDFCRVSFEVFSSFHHVQLNDKSTPTLSALSGISSAS